MQKPVLPTFQLDKYFVIKVIRFEFENHVGVTQAIFKLVLARGVKGEWSGAKTP
jgi:hypothetical protein